MVLEAAARAELGFFDSAVGAKRKDFGPQNDPDSELWSDISGAGVGQNLPKGSIGNWTTRGS